MKALYIACLAPLALCACQVIDPPPSPQNHNAVLACNGGQDSTACDTTATKGDSIPNPWDPEPTPPRPPEAFQ